MKKMIHIVDGAPLFTNCFLLVGSEGHAAAIDPAAPAKEFEAALTQNGATLTHILLTHGHHDHIGSVQALRQEYGAKVYIAEADAKQFGIKADAYFTDGGRVEVDDMVFTSYFTPGHTPGSVCILCDEMLFAGDTLFAEDIGRTDLAGGDEAQMNQSLQKLVRLIGDEVQVFPGHEEFTTMGHEKAHNPYLRF